VPEDRYNPTLELTICLPCVDTLSPLLSPTKSSCFRKWDFSKLNNLISQYNWTNLYNCLDIESATKLFYSFLNSFFCECVPDSFPPKIDRPPWLTNQLQRLRNLKRNFSIKSTKSRVGHPIFQDMVWLVLILVYLTVIAIPCIGTNVNLNFQRIRGSFITLSMLSESLQHFHHLYD